MSHDDLIVYDTLLTQEQVELLTEVDSDYVVASDVYPPDSKTVQVLPMDDAFKKDYEQPDFLNSDIAIADSNGQYHKDGVHFILVPFLVHRSFRGF